MRRRLGVLIAGVLAGWIVLVYPARLLAGDPGAVFATVAALLCLVPTALTLVWGEWAFGGRPGQQLFLALGGTGLRMALVLGVGLPLFVFVPYFHQPAFWVFVLVFYLYTLLLETLLVLTVTPKTRAGTGEAGGNANAAGQAAPARLG